LALAVFAKAAEGTALEVKAMVVAVEACVARVGWKKVVEERAPEATGRAVAAEGEMAQQRVVEAREVAIAVSVTVAERVQEVLAKAVVVAEEMVQETLEAG